MPPKKVARTDETLPEEEAAMDVDVEAEADKSEVVEDSTSDKKLSAVEAEAAYLKQIEETSEKEEVAVVVDEIEEAGGGMHEVEPEEDAPADSRPKLGQPACFLTSDTTPNLLPTSVGGMLLSIKESGLQYLYASARSSIGIKSGRYAFEVKIVETLNPAEDRKAAGARGLTKSLLRVGFSTAGSPLVLGDGEENVCFDENGALLHNGEHAPGQSTAALISGLVKHSVGASVVVLLNLNSGSPNVNTMSLFIDGVRCSPPQALPVSLIGKPLFPTITFKNHTVHANFGSAPHSPLPFRCRMLEDAAMEDVVVTEQKSFDVAEVIFPVFLPDEGTFDWLDWYLSEDGSSYSELSDRAIVSWALKSGLTRQKAAQTLKSCNDKPDMTFGIGSLDDGTVKETLTSLSGAQSRNYVVMEVKGNLTKEDRVAQVKKWSKTGLKKVAQVLMGVPEERYRKRTHDTMLAEKQEKANKVWEEDKVKRKQELVKKKTAEAARRRAEKMIKKME
jgi:hypothetical protein